MHAMHAMALGPLIPHCVQVGFFHLSREGVDYLFVDHPSYHEWAGKCCLVHSQTAPGLCMVKPRGS